MSPLPLRHFFLPNHLPIDIFCHIIQNIKKMKKETLAKLIDHTQLAQTAGIKEIIRLCAEAKNYNFKSVCVNPVYVTICKSELAKSDVKICTVIGFPLGATSSKNKAAETVEAIINGADEVDMVINVGATLECRFSSIEMDIAEVVQAARFIGEKLGKSIVVKVILETCFLSDETIVTCCQCAVRAGADFVKTSTGFATPKDSAGNILPNGASAHHIAIMRKTVGKDFGVKASGGIRNAKKTAEMIAAGANRIGTSSGIQIIENWDESLKIPGWDEQL